MLTLLLLYFSALTVRGLSTPDSGSVKFRRGAKSDEIQISLTMTRNLMNPLGINFERFVVAVDPSDDSKLYGWAQLRPIGSSIRDPKQYNAGPGSGSVEQDIEEEIWDEFEKDDMEFPNGFASLPWSKEYIEFSRASAKRRELRAKLIEQVERKKQSRRNQLWELSSVYVIPEWRSNGIGSELIRRLLAQHALLGRKADDVYLVTVESTNNWYRGFGFELTDDTPASMDFEVSAGEFLTKFMGEKLVVMQGGKGEM